MICFFTLALLLLSPLISYAQNEVAPIRTAVPFLTISPDATSAGMADIGVASMPDVYSQCHNAAKYAFSLHKSAISASYTPWLHNLTGDMFLGYISFYHHIRKTSAIAASLRIFSIGEIEMNDYDGYQIIPLGSYNPFEMAIDVSYSMLLSPRISMGVAIRYTRSDISSHEDPSTYNFSAGNAFSSDISLYYTSRIFECKKINLSYTWGINIRDLGAKIDYGDNFDTEYNHIPTTLSLGAGLHLHHREKNTFSFLLETSKLLVPTPIWDDESSSYITPDKGIAGAIWSALSEAPGGMAEKIKEYSFQCGIQWDYDSRYALRCGWFYSDASKGGYQTATIGTSIRLKNIQTSISYAFSTAHSHGENPTNGSLRFSLCFYLGDKIEK